ncbi:hypothetical protein E4U55_007809 [Claviceps digitariae]|nr:hypothetical protein E4U55_007809 [Claviceps digitariae]
MDGDPLDLYRYRNSHLDLCFYNQRARQYSLIFITRFKTVYDSSRAAKDKRGLDKEYHRILWDDSVGTMLSCMMRLAEYSEECQTLHRRFFEQHVARSLGPYPTMNLRQSAWKSFMTDDHTPLEMSWSWTGNTAMPVVRYAVEPIGWLAGTASDPLNSKATIVCLGDTLPLAPRLDLQWYRHFVKRLVADDGDGQHIHTDHLSQTFIGFDLEKDGMTVKYYFLPTVKSIACGKTNLDLVEESILSLPEADEAVRNSLRMITTYIRSHSQGEQPQVEIFAVDCVEPADSRMKIYVRSQNTTFDGMLDMMTLGRKIPDLADQSVSSLMELWCACFAVHNHPEAMSRPLRSKEHRTGGLLYYFELKTGEALPTSKVYLPVRHYGETDDQIARGLSSYLSKRNQCLQGGLSYYEGVRRIWYVDVFMRLA